MLRSQAGAKKLPAIGFGQVQMGFPPASTTLENVGIGEPIEHFLANLQAADPDVGTDGGMQITGIYIQPTHHRVDRLAGNTLRGSPPTCMYSPDTSPTGVGHEDRNAIGGDHAKRKSSQARVGGISFILIVRCLVLRDRMNDVRMYLTKPNDWPTRNTDSRQEPNPVFGNPGPL